MAGHVYKRGKHWSWRMAAGRVNGKRREITKGGFETRREATAALEKAQEARKKGVDPTRGDVTMSDFWAIWLAGLEHTKRRGTVKNYRGIVTRHLEPVIGDVSLQEVTADHVKAVIDAVRAKGLGPSTVRLIYVVIHASLKAAEKDHRIVSNAADDIDKPPIRDPNEVVPDFLAPWTKAQVDSFLAATHDDLFGPMWCVEYWCALRVGELCGLKWSEVDLEAGVVLVRRTMSQVGGRLLEGPPKSASSRRDLIVEGSPVVAALREVKRRRAEAKLRAGTAWEESGYVFVDTIGRPLTMSVVGKAFRTAVLAAGLPVTSIHGVRHSWASHAADAGASWFEISAWLGHHDATFTCQYYLHRLPGGQARMSSMMGATSAAAPGAY